MGVVQSPAFTDEPEDQPRPGGRGFGEGGVKRCSSPRSTSAVARCCAAPASRSRLPLLDAMIPACTAQAKTAAKTPPRFFGGFVPHGAAPGYWIPEKVGALPDELPFIWKPTGAVPQAPEHPDRPAFALCRAASGRNRRRPLGRGRVPVRARSRARPRAPTSTPARPSTRSSRSKYRAGNAAAVGGNVGRRPGFGFEQLRRRLQLRLHQHDRLGVADHATADGAEPAGRVRAHVRQRQHAPSSARCAASATRASSTRSTARSPALRNEISAAGPCAPRCLHRERARDRASPADRRQRHDSRARGFRGAAGHSAVVRRAHQAHVRPAGAGVPGRHHPRGHLLFARDLTGRVYPESASPTLGLPWRFASRRRPGR